MKLGWGQESEHERGRGGGVGREGKKQAGLRLKGKKGKMYELIQLGEERRKYTRGHAVRTRSLEIVREGKSNQHANIFA